MNSENYPPQPQREIPVRDLVFSTLQARFANQDGVGLLMERLHPEALQWLDKHFFCEKGCQAGKAHVFNSPIFDARIDLWWRMFLTEAQNPLQARSNLGAALFIAGLSIPVMQPVEGEEWSVQELEDYLASYNHLAAQGRKSEIDPEGFSSAWPRKLLAQLLQLCPSLQLTLHSVKRLARQACSLDSEMGDSFSGMVSRRMRQMMGEDALEAQDPPGFPHEMWIYLYAGAIAGGVLPGTPDHPYPLPPANSAMDSQNGWPQFDPQAEIPF